MKNIKLLVWLFLVVPFLSLKAKDGIEAIKTTEIKEFSSLKDLNSLDQTLKKLAPVLQAATVSLLPKNGLNFGSGVVVSEDGLILTADHVVSPMTKGIIVMFPDGTKKEAELLGYNKLRDTAMIRIIEKGKYPFVKMGRSESMHQFDSVIAIGNTGGYNPMRKSPVRLGRVLSRKKNIYTDATVGMGDSGGPLFNLKGEVVGIHIQRGVSLFDNVHVPIEVFLREWHKMTKGKFPISHFKVAATVGNEIKENRFSKPEKQELERFSNDLDHRLKFVIDKLKGKLASVIVNGKIGKSLGIVVSEQGHILAQSSGVKGGPISLKLGSAVYEATVIRRFVKHDLVILEINNKNTKFKPVSFKLKEPSLGSLITSFDVNGSSKGLGVLAVNRRSFGKKGYLGAGNRRHKMGILLSRITSGGPAYQAGLKVNDVIMRLNGKVMDNILIFRRTIAKQNKGQVIDCKVLRDQQMIMIKVTLGEKNMRDSFLGIPAMKTFIGEISSKTTGYPVAIEHDIPISPVECGSGVFDLRGECVGVNVSRASRSRTYAIPADEIVKLLQSCGIKILTK